MADFVEFPTALSESGKNFRIDARNRSGGEGITGREQVQGQGLGRWLADIDYPLNNRERALARDALLARLEGRANYTAVPLRPGALAPTVMPLVQGKVYSGRKLVLPPGVTYGSQGIRPMLIGGAPANATSIIIDPGTTVGIQSGVKFSFNNRLYQIRDIDLETMICQIRPKLREPMPHLAALEFWRCTCLMRLVSDDSGSGSINFGRFGTASMSFVEYW